jgi:ABC-type dipeptide/oligopeptide/nickel transport system permease component
MGRYLIRRILLFIPVFLGATFLIFTLVFLIPGDPIRALAGDRQMSQSTLTALRDRYNLDEPFLTQYGLYVGGIPG